MLQQSGVGYDTLYLMHRKNDRFIVQGLVIIRVVLIPDLRIEKDFQPEIDEISLTGISF